MKNRIAITLALAALAVGVLASASIGQAASKAGSAQSPSGGTWNDVAPLPQTLFGPATATDGTYIYAFGGYHFPEDVGSTLSTVYRYDPVDGHVDDDGADAAAVADRHGGLLPDDEQDLCLRWSDANSGSDRRL